MAILARLVPTQFSQTYSCRWSDCMGEANSIDQNGNLQKWIYLPPGKCNSGQNTVDCEVSVFAGYNGPQVGLGLGGPVVKYIAPQSPISLSSVPGPGITARQRPRALRPDYQEFVSCELDDVMASSGFWGPANLAPFYFLAGGNVPRSFWALGMAAVTDIGGAWAIRESCSQPVIVQQ